MNTTKKTQKTEFLTLFYRFFAGFGLGGILLCLLFGGGEIAFNFALGFGSIGLIIGLWHLSLHFTLGPRKTSWAAESLMVFARYVLLGGLFYAMISLFAVRWLWYCLGTTTILPGLIFTTLLHDRDAEWDE